MNIRAISATAEMFRNSALCILHSALHGYTQWKPLDFEKAL